MAEFEIKRGRKQFRFNLKADNGRKILSSETYQAKSSAKKGVDSVKVNAKKDENFERRTSSDGKPYFVLKATNGEIIGRSQLYSSTGAMEKGIESVKKNARRAKVSDEEPFLDSV